MEVRSEPRSSFAEDDHEARWTHWVKVLPAPSREAKVKYEHYMKLQPEIPQRSEEEKALAYRQPASHSHHDNISGRVQKK